MDTKEIQIPSFKDNSYVDERIEDKAPGQIIKVYPYKMNGFDEGLGMSQEITTAFVAITPAGILDENGDLSVNAIRDASTNGVLDTNLAQAGMNQTVQNEQSITLLLNDLIQEWDNETPMLMTLDKPYDYSEYTKGHQAVYMASKIGQNPTTYEPASDEVINGNTQYEIQLINLKNIEALKTGNVIIPVINGDWENVTTNENIYKTVYEPFKIEQILQFNTTEVSLDVILPKLPNGDVDVAWMSKFKVNKELIYVSDHQNPYHQISVQSFPKTLLITDVWQDETYESKLNITCRTSNVQKLKLIDENHHPGAAESGTLIYKIAVSEELDKTVESKGITVKLPKETLIPEKSIMAIGRDKSGQKNIDFESNKKLVPIMGNPIDADNKVTLYLPWLDDDKNFSFKLAQQLILPQTIKLLLTKPGKMFEEDRPSTYYENAYKLILDCMTFAYGFGNNWSNLDIIQVSATNGGDAGKINPDQTIGYAGKKISTIQGQDPVKVIDSLIDTYLKDNYIEEWSDEFKKIKQVLMALGRYIPSSYAYDKGLSNYNLLANGWALMPSSALDMRKDGKNWKIEDFKVRLNTVHFKKDVSDYKLDFLESNFSEVTTYQLEHKIQLPLVNATLTPITLLQKPGDITGVSQDILKHKWYTCIDNAADMAAFYTRGITKKTKQLVIDTVNSDRDDDFSGLSEEEIKKKLLARTLYDIKGLTPMDSQEPIFTGGIKETKNIGQNPIVARPIRGTLTSESVPYYHWSEAGTYLTRQFDVIRKFPIYDFAKNGFDKELLDVFNVSITGFSNGEEYNETIKGSQVFMWYAWKDYEFSDLKETTWKTFDLFRYKKDENSVDDNTNVHSDDMAKKYISAKYKIPYDNIDIIKDNSTVDLWIDTPKATVGADFPYEVKVKNLRFDIEWSVKEVRFIDIIVDLRDELETSEMPVLLDKSKWKDYVSKINTGTTDTEITLRPKYDVNIDKIEEIVVSSLWNNTIKIEFNNQEFELETPNSFNEIIVQHRIVFI